MLWSYPEQWALINMYSSVFRPSMVKTVIQSLIHMVPLVPFDLKHISCKFGTDLNTFRCRANLHFFTSYEAILAWHRYLTHYYVEPDFFLTFSRSLKPNKLSLNWFVAEGTGRSIIIYMPLPVPPPPSKLMQRIHSTIADSASVI